MGTRIISGVIAAALLVAIILFGGTVGVVAAMTVLCVMAVWELLRAADFSKAMRVTAAVFAVAVQIALYGGAVSPWVPAGVYLLLVTVMCVARHQEITPERAGLLLLLPATAVSGFAALSVLRMSENGLYHFVLALVIPWIADTGAYFSGVAFGKHPLCPAISPKKTVEGLVGGMVLSVAGAIGVSLLLGGGAAVSWWSVAVAAAVGAPLSVCGDLFASVVKRRFGVKDYGKIMPGHGGVMDRFDSVLPVAVWIFLWMQFFPLTGA